MMLFSRFTIKQVLYSVGLLLIIISIPVTVYLVNTRQIFKGKAAAGGFSVGFNATGIIHYGYNDLLPAPASDIDTDLSEINRMGGKIIRIFVANHHITNEEAARRLDVFLTKAATYNISAIVSFINFYGDTGFNPQGTDKYYTDVWSGIPLLGDGFFSGGYKNEYLAFVQTVVNTNKNHPNIYAWEPGNELKNSSSSVNFFNFMKDITATIKSLDPSHPIATGMLNAGHAALTPQALYSLPNIDIITIHNYNSAHDGLQDLQWGLANGKKVILEEFGYSTSGDRSGSIKNDLDFWKSQGITDALQWGFLGKGMVDNGNGDILYGMDTIWHTDYDSLANLYTSYNNVSLPTPTKPMNPTVTPGSCVPRPSCLDLGRNSCLIPEPAEGWCPSPTPTILPSGSPTPTPTRAPVATAPNPSVSCNPNPTGSDDRFFISWTNNANPVTYADIAPLNGFNNNIFYNKAVTGLANSPANTTGPKGFNDHLNGTPLSLSPDTTYYVRLFNGVAQTQPAGFGVFNSSTCPFNISVSPTILPSASPSPSPSPVIDSQGDINGDGNVNLVDMSFLLSRWGKTGAEAGKADLNRDNTVNTFDYSLMLQLLIQKGVIKVS